MGVPKFFRYIAERYPCLMEAVREHQIPEFDNLYIDMNGIIHTCSHPNDFDPHFRISEEQIFKDIFHYIEVLFRMIKPRKLFLMAVDGVAPRAKMNQQRGRRFRSAKEAKVLEEKAKQKGEELPSEARFDSNCITPGTTFMARLQEQLKYFVSYKISTDKLWQKPKIILSGQEVPGEGEHKIMDYIRYMRSQDDWDPSTRHCLCGLDADLIMLGMCSHEPHFSLLREEVKFGKKSKRIQAPEETNFFLLHLSLLRDYLDLEFQELKETITNFEYDLERIIDDWVLMGFLVGNDFIPSLPGLSIADNALPLLYQTYIQVLPKMQGYINDSGELHLGRFQQFMTELGKSEVTNFRDNYADIKYFTAKRGRKGEREFEPFDLEDDTFGKPPNPELDELIKRTMSSVEDGPQDGESNMTKIILQRRTSNVSGEEDSGEESDVDTDEDQIMEEFTAHKKDYYLNKMALQATNDVLTKQAEGYVKAIQWNLLYYYHGCPSWSWFFPHHYAPYISDIQGFSNLNLDFEMGIPWLPYQQLMAVLPAASKQFLPVPFQRLMESSDSPINHFYPDDFDVDMTGKKQEWEGVVLIPFIEQDSLLSAMEPCYEKLTEEEKQRNRHGPMLIYEYTTDNLGMYTPPRYFPTIVENHAKQTEVWSTELVVDKKRLVKGLYPGANDSIHIGFPSLRYLKFDACLKKNKLKVFDYPSRNDNMILELLPTDTRSFEERALEIFSKPFVYVGWPRNTLAKVDFILGHGHKYTVKNGSLLCEPFARHTDSSLFKGATSEITLLYKHKLGIELGDLQYVMFARHFAGTKPCFDANGIASYVKVWATRTNHHPFQTVLVDCKVIIPMLPSQVSIREMFPPGSTAILLGPQYYGSEVEVSESDRPGRVRALVTCYTEPLLEVIYEFNNKVKRSYVLGSQAAAKCGITSHLFSRITGTVLVQSPHTDSDKVNIGLNLKFNKRNEELLGFTRKEGGTWYYSSESVNLVHSYIGAFPELFEFLGNKTGDDVYFKDQIFPENSTEKVQEITAWLKQQKHVSAERRATGMEALEEETVAELEKLVLLFTPKVTSRLVLQVKPQVLYKPIPELGPVPDPGANHQLLDRIVQVRECHTIPFGFRGTIIGIERHDNEDSTLYDILFDKPFVGGLKLFGTREARCYRLTRHSIINLSYGIHLSSPAPTSNVLIDSVEGGSSKNKSNGEWRKAVKPGLAEAKRSEPPQDNTMARKPTADSEFRAIWKVLQNVDPAGVQKTSPAKPKAPLPGNVISADIVSQQTDALRKALKIDSSPSISLRPDIPSQPKPIPSQTLKQLQLNSVPGKSIKPCGHVCCFQALSITCQKLGMAQPIFNYTTQPATKEITCTLQFPGSDIDVSGSPDKEIRRAAESAACIAVKVLFTNSTGPNRQPPMPMMSGVFYGPPPPRTIQTRPGQLIVNQRLPTPPRQWYQPNRIVHNVPDKRPWKPKETPPNKSSPPTKPSSNVNQFVPLQVQMGSRGGASGRKSAEIRSSSSIIPNNSIPPEQGKVREAILVDLSPQSPRNEGPQTPRGNDGPAQQGGSKKSRIAANFRVPLDPVTE